MPPTITTCLVCEGVREEARGKQIILGYFGVAPYVAVALQHLNLPTTLMFVFAGRVGDESDVEFTLSVVNEKGEEISNPAPAVIKGKLDTKRPGVTVSMPFQGVLNAVGRYKVKLRFYSTEIFESSFVVEQLPNP